MKRTLLIAALGIASLLGVSLTLVLFFTRSGSQPVPPAPAPAVAPPVAPPPATAPPPRAPPAVAKGTPRLTWSTPSRDPSAPPMAGRVIHRAVRRALLAAPVQNRLARCVDRDVGFGGGAAPGPIPRGKPATLVLEMEMLEGEVRIVEARVREWGGASEQVVSCAQGVLRGQVARAPTAGPGQRVQMPFPLNPRSEVVVR
ncbi:MAG TPA: hypothetical protein VFR85_16065 [Anaeromyxobacteraceae bacterium]|nr:hypothetical protein [Anaeromyxobacteraceae bacterium]